MIGIKPDGDIAIENKKREERTRQEQKLEEDIKENEELKNQMHRRSFE